MPKHLQYGPRTPPLLTINFNPTQTARAKMSDDLLSWCDDLHQVRGNISQLQATLNQVVAKAPTVAQYKELMHTYGEAPQTLAMAEKLRVLLQSPQLKVAVRLKSLYDKGLMPFLQTFAHINFKSAKSDRYVGYLLDYTPEERKAKDRFRIDEGERTVENGKSIDGADGAKTEPESGQNQGQSDKADLYPPTLPPLSEPVLKLVLTDKSFRQPGDFLEALHFSNSHNRKLALHGSALVDCALISLANTAFPTAHEDDLQHLRFRLTAPHVVARLAYCYNLSEAVMMHISQELPVEDKMRILQTVFYAYVGGMARHGYTFAEIQKWLSKLYQPLFAKLPDAQVKNLHAVAYAEFQFLVTRANNYFEHPTKKLRYDFEQENDDPLVFRLRVGELALASGSGDTALAAKQRAAYNTLTDADLRTKLLTHLLEHYRTPERVEPRIEQSEPQPQPEAEPEDDDDDAYSPELSEDVFTDTFDGLNTGPDPVPSTSISGPAGLSGPTGITSEPQGQLHFSGSGHMPPVGAVSQPVGQPPAPGQAPGQAPGSWRSTPAAAPRMPLPYGALPPIPNMKKRPDKRR